MSKKIFVKDRDLTESYQRNFNKQGIIGYYRIPYEPEPMIKTYCLVLNGKITALGDSLDSVYKCLLDMYYAEQMDCFAPANTAPQLETRIVADKKTAKLTPKRKMLLEQVNMIKTWGRGVIAKIAENLGRKVGAVRQMLSVLTKTGLLVRIQRGHYVVNASVPNGV
ncbi:MAG: hypothetical protein ABFS56_10225 [Pseudomonadota bacterium]